MCQKEEINLIHMMFDSKPISMFEVLLEEHPELDWGDLLRWCYTERSYERVGGDCGGVENPPICYERLEYLERLIEFLERSGVVEAR